MRPLVVTTGEPAGIGPEICVRAALEHPEGIVLLGDRTLLEDTARALGASAETFSRLVIEHIPLRASVEPGKLDVRNSAYVLEQLERAHALALSGEAGGIVTGPVQKSIISEAGHPFTGHTEFFQERSGVKRVVMMLVSSPRKDALRVALATTHLPVRELSSAITRPLLSEITDVLVEGLVRDFGIEHPLIAVSGLNPHAGENGHIGDEELLTIGPAVEAASEKHPEACFEGPLPADTIFIPGRMERFDAVLCMYHDQGLPALKHVGFVEGVNVTLGLPYVRTSVDHGTALDIAGRGVADHRSMLAALQLAQTLAHHRETRMA